MSVPVITPREAALAAVAMTLDELLADAGITTVDEAGALKEPLDLAERGLLLSEIPDDDPTLQQAVLDALAEYHTLSRILKKIVPRFDVTTGGDSFRLAQPIANVRALMEDAKARALFLAGPRALMGGEDPSASEVGSGSFAIDWSYPIAATEGW